MDGPCMPPVGGDSPSASPPHCHDNETSSHDNATPSSLALSTPVHRFRSSLRGRNDSGYLSSSPAWSLSASTGNAGYDTDGTDADMTNFSALDIDTGTDDVFESDFQAGFESRTLYDDGDRSSLDQNYGSGSDSDLRGIDTLDSEYCNQIELENTNILELENANIDLSADARREIDIVIGGGDFDGDSKDSNNSNKEVKFTVSDATDSVNSDGDCSKLDVEKESDAIASIDYDSGDFTVDIDEGVHGIDAEMCETRTVVRPRHTRSAFTAHYIDPHDMDVQDSEYETSGMEMEFRNSVLIGQYSDIQSDIHHGINGYRVFHTSFDNSDDDFNGASISATHYNFADHMSFSEVDMLDHVFDEYSETATASGTFADEEVANITDPVTSSRPTVTSDPIDIPRPSAPIPTTCLDYPDYHGHTCSRSSIDRHSPMTYSESDHFHAQELDLHHSPTMPRPQCSTGCAQCNAYVFVPITNTNQMDTHTSNNLDPDSNLPGNYYPRSERHHRLTERHIHRVNTVPSVLTVPSGHSVIEASDDEDEDLEDDVFTSQRQRSASLPIGPSRTPHQEVGRQLRLLSDEFNAEYSSRRRDRTLSLQTPAFPIHLHIDIRSGSMPWYDFRSRDTGANLDQETQTDDDSLETQI